MATESTGQIDLEPVDIRLAAVERVAVQEWELYMKNNYCTVLTDQSVRNIYILKKPFLFDKNEFLIDGDAMVKY